MCDEPFTCTNDGCSMKFTTEDQANVHRKKHHVMVLNLGLIPKGNVAADQTPTPTRFIRNCEELGLFQDLQNVNPFEETFKKALEVSKTGSVTAIQTNTDDTLHTPHILPHIIANPMAKRKAEVKPYESKIDDVILLVEDDDDKSATIEHAENIEMHEEIDGVFDNNEIKMTVHNQPLTNKLNRQIERNCTPNNPVKPSKPKGKVPTRRITDIARKRESNRMSQLRSRARKKQTSAEFSKRMMDLEEENQVLLLENQQLRLELNRARAFMVRHSQCMFNGEEPTVLGTVASLEGVDVKKNGERMIMPKLTRLKTVVFDPKVLLLPGQRLPPPPPLQPIMRVNGVEVLESRVVRRRKRKRKPPKSEDS